MSTATNNLKRQKMSEEVTRLLDLGWTVAQLAAIMRVTPGTVHTWKRGATMGLNSQRRTLSELRSPADERKRFREIAQHLRREADISERQAAECSAASAFHIQKSEIARAARLRGRAAVLEGI